MEVSVGANYENETIEQKFFVDVYDSEISLQKEVIGISNVHN